MNKYHISNLRNQTSRKLGFEKGNTKLITQKEKTNRNEREKGRTRMKLREEQPQLTPKAESLKLLF